MNKALNEKLLNTALFLQSQIGGNVYSNAVCLKFIYNILDKKILKMTFK